MLRVAQMGLGPIGRAVAKRVARHPSFELVGAADPALAGEALDDLLGADLAGRRVVGAIDDLLARDAPEVVIHCTGSFLEDVMAELRAVLERGVRVVSTCEELSFPFYRSPSRARELDETARAAGAVVIGTGVNPGFVMDKLVVTLMAACDTVRSVRVSRVVDAARRREPFQRKVGAGMAPAAFESKIAGGRCGHIGLAESAHMLAEAMGVGPERVVHEELRPVLAERRVSSEHLTVEVGQVSGIHQTAQLVSEGRERVSLEIEMAFGAPRPRDTVWLEGSPPVEMEITSGVPGDEGTAAVVLSTTRLVRSLEPGLRTMLDVPLRPPTGPD